MNRTHRSANAAMMAVLFVMFLVLSAAVLTVAGASADTRSLGLLADESPCHPVVDKWALPTNVLLGETVDVTITVRPVCPAEASPMHLVLVLDASGTMAGDPTVQMKQAATLLVKGLDMPNDPRTKVGVVQFNSSARTLSQLTNEERRVISAINRVGAHGGSRIDAGIYEGLRVLHSGRGATNNIVEVMLVLSDGGNNAGCSPVLQAARQAKGQGILLIAICVGTACDQQCMRQVASSPSYYFRAQHAASLHGILDTIRNQLRQVSVKRLVVRETISSTLQYVPDSASPPQAVPDVPSDWLQWEEFFISKEGVTFTYKVKSLKAGSVPIGAATTGTLTDSANRLRTFAFPVPRITVLRPGALQTPDWTVTPTPSTTPTFTPTPTVTPTPTASPTPRPRPLYLPCLLDESVW